MKLKYIISIVLFAIFKLILHHQTTYGEYDVGICKVLFLLHIMLAYLIRHSLHERKEEGIGGVWILPLGILCIDGIMGLIAWATPEMIPYLSYCIGFGSIIGLHLYVMIPGDTISDFLHSNRDATVKKLDKIFDPKKKEDNHEGTALHIAGLFL